MTENQAQSDRTISRRTIARGVAWSVPTVATAVAAPALAASKPNCPTLISVP